MKQKILSGISLAIAAACLPTGAAAGVIGMLGNFDVINDTGKTAHGFEIDLEGLHASDITDTFGGVGRGFPSGRGFDPATSVVRYGAPSITEYSSGSTFGTKVTYMGLFDGTNWDYGTPSGSFITPGDNCWSGGGIGYTAATPCDHFGVGTLGNAIRTTYSWLLETATAGVLTNGTVSLPAPAWNVIPAPPPAPGLPPAPPVVAAVIEAPVPEAQDRFGEAMWVKVFTTELEDAIDLEELVGGNPKVEAAVTEVEWQLLQKDPGNPLSGLLESGYGAPVGPKAASILRRYEFYRYAGFYDPDSNEAKPYLSDSNPLENPLPGQASDLGNYLGAQNAALNLDVAAIVVPPAGIPEPGGAALGLLGLAALGFGVRRR